MKQLCTAALLAAIAACSQAVAADAAKHPIVDFASCRKPIWPKADLEAEHTGTVTLKFTVDQNGAVTDAAIVNSSGHPALDEAARTGISKCRFKQGPGSVEMKYIWPLG
ncbi:energy transducer TonB [Pseudoduganella violaceinigra]|uniref:energy transducer TonB n=1 Tax=Pseudoduganella violaceinigra TaxID=246602 RepID=UPI0004132ACC|nr:energy transducer TonB [Pseudoduganella violaceinigra]